MKTSPEKPFIVRAGTAPSASLSPTDRTEFPFAGVAGQPEFFINQGGRGDATPLHRHPWASWELVLEGTVRFFIDDQVFVASAGDFVHTPASAAHAYVVESERARMVGVNFPHSRFAEMQQKAEPLFRGATGPDMPAVMKLAGEHGLEILGPPPAIPPQS